MGNFTDFSTYLYLRSLKGGSKGRALVWSNFFIFYEAFTAQIENSLNSLNSSLYIESIYIERVCVCERESIWSVCVCVSCTSVCVCVCWWVRICVCVDAFWDCRPKTPFSPFQPPLPSLSPSLPPPLSPPPLCFTSWQSCSNMHRLSTSLN